MLVSVMGLYKEVTALQVTATVGGLSASQTFPDSPATFAMYLPDGAMGSVVVDIDALVASGCVGATEVGRRQSLQEERRT